MNKAFEETTMKNVPINQFWSFKWRNGAQNWNLHENLSKIGPVGNFDFWSKVNAKSQSQLVHGQSQRILVRVGSGFPGRVTGRAVEPMKSSYDMSLTWLMTCLGLMWLLTWSHDIIKWRQQQCFGTWKARAKSTGTWRRCRKPRWRVRRHMTTRFSSEVDWWTTRPSGRRVDQEDDLEMRNLRRRVRDFPKLSTARGGAWLAFGWPDFWVFLAEGLGARLWDRFWQAKAWCAQIW